jgi:ADP-glucose pyrophosphorylase
MTTSFLEICLEEPEHLSLPAVRAMVFRARLKDHSSRKYSLVSMGTPFLKAELLKRAFASHGSDFGKEIIPGLLGKNAMQAAIFDDDWQEIGIVRTG